jgi:hypothetical protein
VAWNPFRRKAEPERGRGDSPASSTGTGPHASEDEQTASWREFATLITPDAGLVDVVMLAHHSPAEYLRMHATAAENRGLEDDDVDPWFALVDWLIENEFAHELDWKENAAELAWGLSRMTAVLASGVDLQSVDDADAHLTFGMLRANALLAPAGLELVVFDVDSDSYPVVLVETKRRDRIVALAQTLGHRVDVMTLERARHEGGRGYTGDIEL